MNKFSEFILLHENDDTDRLLLNKAKYAGSGIDIALAVNTILCRKKLRSKVPSFYSEPSLIYPRKLSAEQCSSEDSAQCKIELIRGLCQSARPGKLRIADLTGGLGVDSAAFAAIAEKVLYNEMNPELAEAARHNFAALGLGNITVSNTMLVPEGEMSMHSIGMQDKAISTPSGLLSAFRPDIIFLDPARRAEDGKKVFLLEDCQPDILTLKDELLQLSRLVMVKLSPMADIDMVVNRLGQHCRIIETVSIKGECKELLAVLDREHTGECTISANCNGNRFTFMRSEEAQAAHEPESSGSLPKSGQDKDFLLLEPDKALMKAAPFNLLCKRFGLTQLDSSTHYFITGLKSTGPSPHIEPGNPSDGQGHATADGSMASSMRGFFKIFQVIKAVPLDKRSIKEFSREFPEAEVTARNIPMTSDMLRKKLGVSPSDEFHIFGLKVSRTDCLPIQYSASSMEIHSSKAIKTSNWLFACRRLPM